MGDSQAPRGRWGDDLPPDLYPWEREAEALEALDQLDVVRCRRALDRLAEEIRVPPTCSPGCIAQLLTDLLMVLRTWLYPAGPPPPGLAGQWTHLPGRTERLRRAEGLGSAVDAGDLRTAFLGEVEILFAPLASVAALSPAVLRARAYLDRHYTRKVTLRELAESVHLSPNYLSSVFRREVGLTVTQYLRRRRMRLAEQLLMEGKHTISEVAYRVGYQNYRDFHRNFVREGRRSPRSFQRLCRSRRNLLEGVSEAARGSPE